MIARLDPQTARQKDQIQTVAGPIFTLQEELQMHDYFLNTQNSIFHRDGCGHVPEHASGTQWKYLGWLANWTFARIEAESHVAKPKRCRSVR